MTTPQLPPLPEPGPAYDFTEDSLVYSVGEAKKIQREAFDAGAALSARPVAESIHEANARTLQALVDELRQMLGVKEGESLTASVRFLQEDRRSIATALARMAREFNGDTA